jgi:hypothetical protein
LDASASTGVGGGALDARASTGVGGAMEPAAPLEEPSSSS